MREDLEASRRRLDHLQSELDGIIETAAATPPDDEHDVEGSSVGFERARVTALVKAERDHLAALEAAQARVEYGTYGVCEVCGERIPAERLEALPATTTCVGCAAR